MQLAAVPLTIKRRIVVQHALVAILLVFALALSSIPAWGLESLVPYDDFESSSIDPGRWFADQFSVGGPTVLESVRHIATDDQGGRRLRLSNRAYGPPSPVAGSALAAVRLGFPASQAVTAIQANVEVKRARAIGCAGPVVGETDVAARIGGRFFKTGPFPFLQRDVFATVDVVRRSDSVDPAGTYRVRTVVSLCLDGQCQAANVLDSHELGTVQRDQVATLLVQWDPANDRFIFQLNADPQYVFAYAAALPHGDDAPALLPLKRLEIAHHVANCTGDPGSSGYMAALFDDVFVNEGALSAQGQYPYPYYPYGASLLGPVRPAVVGTSLALVVALVIGQLDGWRRRSRRR
jgi:hypothetical protein